MVVAIRNEQESLSDDARADSIERNTGIDDVSVPRIDEGLATICTSGAAQWSEGIEIWD